MEGDLRSAGQSDHILHGVPTHNGYYVNYNVLGDNFEVSAKYVLPLWPILKGSYGLVCAAVNSETGEKVAIKKIKDAFVNRINAKRVLREIKLLQQMDHENIIAIMDIIQPPRREEFNDIYIVYELMEADLHHVIHSREMLTEDYCQFFLYNLLRGLKYMHSANVVHRDLKPSNLFINSNDEFKIGDFGLAWTTTETDSMTEYAMSQWYHPPELLLNCPEYTAAIDIWSVGCIFMEILTRKTILPGRDSVQQLHLIMELVGSPEENDLNFLKSENARRYINQLPKYTSVPLSQRFPDVNPQAIDLVNRMLVFNPSKRITVTDALDHSYLAALHDIEDEPTCDTPFDFEFEKASITEDQVRELIWQESLSFNSCP